MQAIMETLFDVVYLSTVIILGFQMILKGKYKRVLVLATGALLNPVMTNQKLSIPCVCHGYVLEGVS